MASLEKDLTIVGFDSLGAGGKDSLIVQVSRGLARLGARVHLEEQPSVILDDRAQVVYVRTPAGLLNTRDHFKQGFGRGSGPPREQELNQLRLTFEARKWLFQKKLQRLDFYSRGSEPDLSSGDILLLNRTDFSTIVYQGLLPGRVLADQYGRFVRNRIRSGIPSAHSTVILLSDDLEKQERRLRERRSGERQAGDDIYDDRRQQGYHNSYIEVAAESKKWKRDRISMTTFSVPSSKIEGSEASFTETMVLLWAITNGLIHNAKFMPEVKDWVRVQDGSNQARGWARVRIDLLLRQTEGGLAPRFAEWLRKDDGATGDLPSIELAYFYRRWAVGDRDHMILSQVAEKLRTPDRLSAVTMWGDFALTIPATSVLDGLGEVIFNWDQGSYAQNLRRQ